MSADTFNTTGEAQDLSDAPVLEASISGLWDELEANAVAAGQKYGGSAPLRYPISDDRE